jgi:hypothetical protein
MKSSLFFASPDAGFKIIALMHIVSAESCRAA